VHQLGWIHLRQIIGYAFDKETIEKHELLRHAAAQARLLPSNSQRLTAPAFKSANTAEVSLCQIGQKEFDYLFLNSQSEIRLPRYLVYVTIGGNSMADLTGASHISTTNQYPYQAYQILRFGFTVAPILAGTDKFLHLLVNWDQYLPPIMNNLVRGHGHQLMLVVGVIEIVAGLGVAFKPRIFAYVVAAWLLLIICNLLAIPGYFDVALRDLGLFLGALALGRLSHGFD
jgi:uncharacterized membrane protein YphA (DoxX/SURF4 family)